MFKTNPFQKLMYNDVLKDMAKLVAGVVAGRAILLLAMPIVTRIYQPEDFKLLAIVMAVTTIVSVVACLRLEIAIPLALNHRDATNLLALSLLFALSTAIVFYLVSLLATNTIVEWTGEPQFSQYFWLISIGIFLTASFSALQFWLTRMRRFGIISRTRVRQAIWAVFTMFGLGWLGWVPLGLLLGNILSFGSGILYLFRQIWLQDKGYLARVSFVQMRRTLSKNRRYFVYSVPDALLNAAGLQIPVLIIASQTGEAAGHLFLALQIMSVPITLIGSSMTQVYSSRAVNELQNGTLAQFTKMIMIRLLLFGLGPMLAAALLGPWLFPIIFSAEWARAGEIVAWIAPWMLFQLVASPVSTVLNVTGRQSTGMFLQLFGLISHVGAVMTALALQSAYAVEFLAVSGLIFYVIYSIVIITIVKNK